MQIGGLDLQLNLIGSGISSFQQALYELVQQLVLSQLVTFLGSQPRSSPASHYCLAHVVVVSSLDNPLPPVVLEAMACGRPVLGSAVGGISYLVRDGLEGLLVPSAQPSALAEGIARLVADRTFLKALGRAVLERSSHFSWKNNVRAIQELVSDPTF